MVSSKILNIECNGGIEVVDVEVRSRVNPDHPSQTGMGVFAKRNIRKGTLIPEAGLIENFPNTYGGYNFGVHGFNTIELPNEDAMTIKPIPKDDELLMPKFYNRDLNLAHTPSKYLSAARRKMKHIRIEGCDCPTCITYPLESNPFYDPIKKVIRFSRSEGI